MLTDLRGHYTILYKKEDFAEMTTTNKTAGHPTALHNADDVTSLTTEHRSEQVNLLTSIPSPSLGLDRTYSLGLYSNPPCETDGNDYYQDIWPSQWPGEQGVFGISGLSPGMAYPSGPDYLSSNSSTPDHFLQDNLFWPLASPMPYYPHQVNPTLVPPRDLDSCDSPDYGPTFRLPRQHEYCFRLNNTHLPYEVKTMNTYVSEY